MEVKTDILVIGAGVSGTMAAIAAARKGAKVSLIERGGCLGGMWTAGLVGVTLDSEGKDGLLKEFLAEVDEQMATGSATLFETQKYILEKMCIDSGVDIYLHSQICNLEKEDRIIKSVQIITKSGLINFNPKIVIDATGDGDVAFMAGCGFEYGRESDNKAQPMSMIALISGLKDDAREYISYPSEPFWDARNRFRYVLDRCGAKYSIGCPSIQPLNGGMYILSANQEYGKSGCSVCELSQATINARSEIYEMVKKLKTNGPKCFENITLVSTPEFIGVRETRRINGRYTVSIDDMIEGKKQDDAVCTVNYWVDIHSLEDDGGKGFTDDGVESKPYDIPFRALLPKDIDNLVLAGRCISGDFYAHASYRVMGNMAPVGEAAGNMAAYAIQKNAPVHTIKYKSN